jgi:hypothetical protein
MSEIYLMRLARKYQNFREAKGPAMTLPEYSDLFNGLLDRFLNKNQSK